MNRKTKMAIEKNIINSILDSMNYNDFDSIEITKDEMFIEDSYIIVVSSECTINIVYGVDKFTNQVMYMLQFDKYLTDYNNEYNSDNEIRYFDLYLNHDYIDNPRLMSKIDEVLKNYVNNYSSITDDNSISNVKYHSLVETLWYNANEIYDDNPIHYFHMNLTTLCDYMDDCKITLHIQENYDMVYGI